MPRSVHGERGADRLLGRGGAERDHDDLPGGRLFFSPERLFDGELVVRIEDELDARFVERFAVGGEFLTRVSESGTRLMHTAIFMGAENKPDGGSCN